MPKLALSLGAVPMNAHVGLRHQWWEPRRQGFRQLDDRSSSSTASLTASCKPSCSSVFDPGPLPFLQVGGKKACGIHLKAP